MAAFISGGAEPEPEPQPDPSESKLPLMALSADGTVYQHELTFFDALSCECPQAIPTAARHPGHRSSTS